MHITFARVVLISIHALSDTTFSLFCDFASAKISNVLIKLLWKLFLIYNFTFRQKETSNTWNGKAFGMFHVHIFYNNLRTIPEITDDDH